MDSLDNLLIHRATSPRPTYASATTSPTSLVVDSSKPPTALWRSCPTISTAFPEQSVPRAEHSGAARARRSLSGRISLLTALAIPVTRLLLAVGPALLTAF